MHIYLDEDVDVLIADLLRNQGFAVTTTLDAGNIAWTDDEQLAYATDRRMVILTHNRNDFQQLAHDYFIRSIHHTGIIIAVRRSPYAIAARLVAVINQITADEMINQLIFI